MEPITFTKDDQVRVAATPTDAVKLRYHGWTEATVESVGASDLDETLIPPKGGAGSGREHWAAYAASLGVAVDDGDSRDDIIEKLEEDGHVTE